MPCFRPRTPSDPLTNEKQLFGDLGHDDVTLQGDDVTLPGDDTFCFDSGRHSLLIVF